MNLKLYRQKQRLNAATGKMIYQGQDSHPYADDDLLIVADGLGGRGGFAHKKMKGSVLDKNLIYDVLFKDLFDESVDEDFKSFVVNNFEELFIFDEEEYYSKGDEYVRRSGYFASRIVTAIVLHEMKYNPEFNKKSIFDSIEGASDAERDEIAARIGARLAVIVREKLERVAENGGFELEVNNRGAYLLPTTLTVALLNEREKDVEVLYLWAGDSRGYTWSERDGMRQVTEDHEQDETMTNNISLSREFTIEGRFLTVARPCAIFNASDGVYKPPSFVCPIDQEVIFLSAIIENEDEQSAMASLVEQYNMLSPDDSSTLALKSYDYASYDELKAAAQRRMDAINEDYVAALPGIFTEDYQGDLLKLEGPLSGRIAGVADELIKVEGVYALVRQDMINKNYPPYLRDVALLSENAASADGNRLEVRAKIKEWVCDNWIGGAWLKHFTTASNSYPGDESPYDAYNRFNEEYRVLYKEHKERIKQANLIIHEAKEAHLTPLFNRLCNLSSVLDPENAGLVQSVKDELLKAFKETFDYIEGVCGGEDEIVRKYVDGCRKKQEVVDVCLEQDAEIVESVVDRIISEPDTVKVFNDDVKKRAHIDALHSEYAAIEVADDAAMTEEDVARKHVPEYWNGNERLYGLIWNSHRHLVPEELIEKMIGDDEELAKKRASLRENLAKRTELYDKYNEGYYTDYRSSRI